MRRRTVPSFVAVTFLLLSLPTVQAEVPSQINYQGYLTDDEGIPIDRIVEMIFCIYGAETGGIEYWCEGPIPVDVDNGVYNVILGQITPFTSSLLTGPCWFGGDCGGRVFCAP